MPSALHTSWHTVKVSFTHSSFGPSRATSSAAGVAVTQTMFMSCSGSAKAATIGPGSEVRVSERVSVVLTTTVSEMTIAAGVGCTGLSMLSMPADLRKMGALRTAMHIRQMGMTLREEGSESGVDDAQARVSRQLAYTGPVLCVRPRGAIPRGLYIGLLEGGWS